MGNQLEVRIGRVIMNTLSVTPDLFAFESYVPFCLGPSAGLISSDSGTIVVAFIILAAVMLRLFAANVLAPRLYTHLRHCDRLSYV